MSDIVKLGWFGGALAGAIGAVLLFGKPSEPEMQAGHQHGAGPGSGSAQPVDLSPADARRIGVTFAEVKSSPLAREIRTVAQVTYDETRVATITTKVDGWVELLHVNSTGQLVRKGDPLFRLYAPMIMTAEQDLLLARRLGTEVSTGTADAVRGAGSLIESAERRLRYWDLPEEEIARLTRTGDVSRSVTFHSAVNGVVVEKSVLMGQRIMAGDPLYRIADLSTVWIEGEVFERDLPAVRMGQRVTAELPALPGDVRSGTITYISPMLNPDTRTAAVRVELSNPGLALKPGMYATLRFTMVTAPVLSIPRSAVLVTGERALAFLKRSDGAFEPRQLTLGQLTDDRVEVLSGLAAGDSVVASATFLVDAESNLGTIMGGMGNMPGMDIRPGETAGEGAAVPERLPGESSHSRHRKN